MAKLKQFPTAAERLAQKAADIRLLAQSAVTNIERIGMHLAEAKELVPHGQWGAWLASEFEWTERTARNYLRVYEAFKTETVSDLDIDAKALYLLSRKKTPPAVRDAAIEMARTGHVSHAKVTAMLQQRPWKEVQRDERRQEQDRRANEKALQADKELRENAPQLWAEQLNDCLALFLRDVEGATEDFGAESGLNLDGLIAGIATLSEREELLARIRRASLLFNRIERNFGAYGKLEIVERADRRSAGSGD